MGTVDTSPTERSSGAFVTVPEAARILARTPESILDLIDAGALNARLLRVVSITSLIDFSRTLPAGGYGTPFDAGAVR